MKIKLYNMKTENLFVFKVVQTLVKLVFQKYFKYTK